MNQPKTDPIGILFLLIAMLTWASSFIALKSAIGPLGPMSVVFGRMVIASLCFVYFIKQFRALSFTRHDIKYILLLTLLSLVFILFLKPKHFNSPPPLKRE
ncbi:MAG: DMT family transporter [Sulfurospirillum sp.]|nr:DMT family transporter [Sulfurospirillum sp.]